MTSRITKARAFAALALIAAIAASIILDPRRSNYGWAGIELLTAEWISAIFTAIGTCALIFTAWLAERIRQSQERREKRERKAVTEQRLLSALFRIRSTQEDCESIANVIEQAKKSSPLPNGLVAAWLQQLGRRLDAFRFQEDELIALGKANSLSILDAANSVDMSASIVREAQAIFEERPRHELISEADGARIDAAIAAIRKIGAIAANLYKSIGE